jgi:bifunctional non-homologous end joining protein LigD
MADRLEAYRAKRSASATPEPFGARDSAPASGGGLQFVVQMHAARRLHYDFRLEWEGVLLSWAVPRGPSPNPQDKRLAVHTEDHPLDYADFEGFIPEGSYGAGAVIVWDRGIWIPLEDPDAGMEKGKLLFELRGYKLHGVWTLVKTKEDWLLIKERDGFASDKSTEDYPQDSVYSGLTVAEMKGGVDRVREIEAELEDLEAPHEWVDGKEAKAMLATPRDGAFTREGWIFEIKYDGYRLIVAKDGQEVRLWSRAGNDLTETFPEVARATSLLPFPHLVLDGEVVVHDADGLPSFSRLQRRSRLTRRGDVARAAVTLPATLYLFDLLGFQDFDVRPLPLLERKRLLRRLLPSTGPLRFSDHIAEQGEAMFDQVQQMRLEGIVAKKEDAPYRGVRSREWLKIRADRSSDFVIVGFTEPTGSRKGLGALHVGQYAGDDLLYVGRVGSGFTGAQLDELRQELEALEVDDAPVEGPAPSGDGHHWVRPQLVAEVRFKEFTDVGLLRQPVFQRIRDDKPPADCRLDDPKRELAEPEAVSGEEERAIPFTNLDKLFWPEGGYTKGDLIEYYRTAWEWMEPYLEDRCVVLTRYPDGIDGKSFYQKDAPGWAPEWLRTVTVWSESSERELSYFVVENQESLLYLANLATIPLHIWSSRVGTLGKPDWCVIDLDPKDAPFSDVVKVAVFLKGLCDELELPTYVKTTGSTGLHILIPLGRQCTYEQSRTLGHLLAHVAVAEMPEIATITRTISQRDGKVYIDFLQNRHGQLIVAPFSVRPVPEAAVSTPLTWDEVNGGLKVRRHTIQTVAKRMKKLGHDPMRAVLDVRPDLMEALGRLSEKLG